MSGGHFDYNQYKIGQIADDIQSLIDNNGSESLDSWGQLEHQYPPEIINRFRMAVDTLRIAEIMAQRVDWLVSGDDGEDSFFRRWDKDLKGLST